jgi:hypothetical protein
VVIAIGVQNIGPSYANEWNSPRSPHGSTALLQHQAWVAKQSNAAAPQRPMR